MQLKDYINVIRKRWWLALVVAVAAAAVAFLYSMTQPKIYETSVTVVGKTAKPDTGLDNSVKSELHRLQSTISTDSTAAQIDQAAQLDLDSGQILSKIKVVTRPDDYILMITVDDTDPQRAALIANTAADLVHEQYLESQSTIPDDSKIFFDKIAVAPVPDKPSLPRTNLYTGAAALLGLVLGLILIFIVEFFDNSLRTEEDVERFTGLNVLGVVPSWRSTGKTVPITVVSNGRLGYSADASSDGVEVQAEASKVKK